MQSAISFPKFDRVKKALITECEYRAFKMGDGAIFNFVLQEFRGNYRIAESFMVAHCGFTYAEVKRLKRRFDYSKAHNKSQGQVGIF